MSGNSASAQRAQYNPQNFRPGLFSETVRHLYSLLWIALLPLTLLVSLYKVLSRSKDYGARLSERYGFIPKPKRTGGILLHCVSVGEVVAATTLVKAILAKHPKTVFTITTTTPTGSERVKQTFGDSVNHFYLSYDLPMAMNNLLNTIKPEKVMITEVELWPNLIHSAWKQQIPVYIVNARLTNKSRQAYSKLSALFVPMLHKVTAVCAQGQRDYDNYLALGAKEEQVVLTNNIKFDQAITTEEQKKVDELQQQLTPTNRTVLIAGSTHEPEEQVLLDAYKELKPKHPDLLLIIVPRHPQRFSKVEQLIQKQALSQIKVSENISVSDETDVVLADQMGILKALYGISNVAFVGGSIADKGGHNALEAALFGIPVVMGSHTYNNPAICDALAEAGALQTADTAPTLVALLQPWLDDPVLREKDGQTGKRVVIDNSGAIGRTLEVLGK